MSSVGCGGGCEHLRSRSICARLNEKHVLSDDMRKKTCSELRRTRVARKHILYKVYWKLGAEMCPRNPIINLNILNNIEKLSLKTCLDSIDSIGNKRFFK